ncbi:hypothetical protein LOD99_227 [Oopsacas minuta]|uniref:Uncharacterized protein n=1 Tax=Oopsacas minuta TaxID=111878 RepID=A0AAV7K8X8_9METZ|nr:hypothetical protein LOD99_227 [Oopsacas minuta]
MAERLFHTDYPIYSLCQVEPGKFVIGGGGGASNCGIPNVVELYSISVRGGEKRDTKNQGRYSASLLCRKELDKEAMWHLERHSTDSKLLTGSLNSKCVLMFLGNLPTTEISEDGVPASLPVIEYKGEVGTGCGEDLRQKQARFSPKGDLLATVSTENVVRLWTLPQLEPCGLLQGHTSEITDIAFHPDGSKLVSIAEDNIIRIWLIDTFSELFKVEWPVEGCKPGIKENCRNCRVITYLDKKAKLTRSILITTHNRAGIRQRGSTIVQWDLELGSVLRSIKAGVHPLCALEVCQEAELIAVGNVEGQIRIYNTSSLRYLRGIQAHSVSITSMQFLSLSTDNKKQPAELILLTTSIDRTCCATRCRFSDLKRWLYFFLLPLIFLILAYLFPYNFRYIF